MKLLKGLLFLSFLYALSYASDIDKANEYFYLGEYRKAIEFYKKGVPTASSPYQIYYNLGICYEMLGNFESALFYYRKALPLKTSAVRKTVDRVGKRLKKIKIAQLTGELKANLASGSYKKASELADKILKLNPQNKWAKDQKRLIMAKTSEEKKPPEKPEQAPPPAPEIPKREIPPYPKFVILSVVIILIIILLFLFRRRITSTKKKSLYQTLSRLMRETEAGMVSIKRGSDLGILFFENEKVINAYWENHKKGTSEVLEGKEALCAILEKDPKISLEKIFSLDKDSSWSEFGRLFLDIHREAAGKERSHDFWSE